MKHTAILNVTAVRRSLAIIWLFSLIWTVLATAQETFQPPVEVNREAIIASIENSVAVESDNLAKLKHQVAEHETLRRTVLIEINAYELQNIVHNNFLLQPDTTVATLEKAAADNQQALDTIRSKIEALKESQQTYQALQNQTQDQITLSAQQAESIQSSSLTDAEKNAAEVLLERLDRILTDKLQALQTLNADLSLIVKQLTEIETTTLQLKEEIGTRIDTRRDEVFFDRKPLLNQLFKKERLAREISLLTTKLTDPLASSRVVKPEAPFGETVAIAALLVVVLITTALLITTRMKRLADTYVKNHPFTSTHRWRLLVVNLLRRSVVILGALFVLYGYDFFRLTLPKLPLHRPATDFLMVILVARWVIDYLNFRQPGAMIIIPSETARTIIKMTLAVSFFTLLYLVTHRILGDGSVILFAGRLVLEIGLLLCTITFWRALFAANPPTPAQYSTAHASVLYFFKGLTFFITIGGVIIELAGYPALAVYWYLSWGRSLIVLFWATLFFNVIAEWRKEYKTTLITISGGQKNPVRRAFISISALVWFIGVVLGLVLAWGTRPSPADEIYSALDLTFTIGKITINLMDFLLAGLILFLTLVLSRLGRYYLSEKILANSDLEPGLQGSITAIAVYLFWGLSVILALSVLGISTTSLALAFGALGVGLGFGLQAIFNNFISGIILLFERPIQVGDEVEINGVWSTVKKINVRATVVQTYDNASLIIPNSEFISSVVKNWSFKDRRIRRDIIVGVAYGSDIDLVRETLLDIAVQKTEVLNFPKPDVVFDDFDDSALTFRLRIWIDVDHVISVPSEIRFEIDRAFRELDIEIAFPQRDIHVRSIVGENADNLHKRREDEETA